MRRWKDRMLIYPVIAAILALVLWSRDARPETVPERLEDGALQLCEKAPPPPLLKFCVVLTVERGWKKR